MAADLPKLRQLEVFPARQGKEELLGLRDPLGYADNVVTVSASAVLVLQCLDGKHTLGDIQRAVERATGQLVPLPTLERFVRQLDEARLLESRRFAAFLLELRQEFDRQPVRPAAHAGTSYPKTAAALRKMLDEHYQPPRGPGRPAAADGTVPRALLVPHIDLRRGGPTFAWGYAQWRAAPPADTYVILGVAHAPTAERFIGTKKAFASPLGTLETDGEFMDRLAGKLPFDLYADELVHRREHSIEFQVVYLQHLQDGQRPVRMAPVLVGSFHDLLETEEEPLREPQVAAFVRALRETIAESGRRVGVIASVDLAHVGARFGDEFTVNEGVLQELAAEDRQMMACLARGDAAAFLDSIYRDHDRRRVDAWPAVYTMLHACDVTRGELLHYDQSVEPDTNSVVTFASMKFW